MSKKILYTLAFLIKGWEVSLLLILPILKTQGKITVYELGILAAVLAVFQIVSSLFSGILAEKIGSKKVMISSLFFYGLSWILLSFSVNLKSLFMVAALGGTGSGLFIPLANSAIAKLSEKNRAKEMGDFSAFTDIGRIVLSGLTAFLIGGISIFATSLVFGFLATTSAIVLTRIAFVDMHEKHGTILPAIRLRDFLKIKRFVYAVLTGVFDVFASSSLFIFIPLLLIPKDINISSVGFLSALFFAGYLAGRLFLGRLADKYGAVKILVFSEMFMAALIIYLIFENNFLFICGILFTLGVFTRGTSPVIRAMMADSVSEKHKFDKAFSIHSFALNISQVTSRSVYGFSAGLFGIASVFYLAAFVATATMLPLYLYNKSKQS